MNAEAFANNELQPIAEYSFETDMAFEANNEPVKLPSCDDKTAEVLFKKLLRRF